MINNNLHLPKKSRHPELIEVALDNLEGCKWNPEDRTSPKKTEALFSDLETHGLVVPPVVIPIGNTGHYKVVLGHRRTLWHRENGFTHVWVIIDRVHTEHQLQTMELKTTLAWNGKQLISAIDGGFKTELTRSQEGRLAELAEIFGDRRSAVAFLAESNLSPSFARFIKEAFELLAAHAPSLPGFDGGTVAGAKAMKKKLALWIRDNKQIHEIGESARTRYQKAAAIRVWRAFCKNKPVPKH